MNLQIPRPILPKSDPTSTPPPPGGPRQFKRTCVSIACVPCLKRKSKCDARTPECYSCNTLYHTVCHYDINSDKRRKGTLRRLIEGLTAEKAPLGMILDGIKTGSEAEVDEIVQLIRENTDKSYDLVAEKIHKMRITNTRITPALEQALDDFAGKPVLGHHYGHTSNLALPGSQEHDLSTAVTHSGSWTTVTNNADFIKHLFELYFAWCHPFSVLLLEEAFFHGYMEGKLKYCSPILVNALLAIACQYSDRLDARSDPDDPSTTGSHFFAEAKRLLYSDERSCLTTVQALGIMSLREVMNNHDSSGWKFAGQMSRMAIELGLHIPSPAQPNNNLSSTEIASRRVTVWGVFNLETALSICVGRISSISRTSIKIDKPLVQSNLEGKIWKPYGYHIAGLEQSCFTYNLLMQISVLSEIVNDVVNFFYAPGERITSRRMIQHFERFECWEQRLPECLLIQEHKPTLPQVISVHLYYHNCVIHLFRPFIRLTLDNLDKRPIQICTKSARKISQLVELHQRLYECCRSVFIMSHCTVTAGAIHTINLMRTNSDSAADYLVQGIRALREMGVIFPIAMRHLNALRHLVHTSVGEMPPAVKNALDEVPGLIPATSLVGLALRPTLAQHTLPNHNNPEVEFGVVNSSSTLQQEPRNDPAPTKATPQDNYNTYVNTALGANKLPHLGSLSNTAARGSWNNGLKTNAMMEVEGGDMQWAQMNQNGFTVSNSEDYSFDFTNPGFPPPNFSNQSFPQPNFWNQDFSNI